MYLELNPAFESARGFLQQIEVHFASEKSSIHKARNTIKKISFESHDFIVKSFGVPNFLNQLVYGIFRDSKAKRSFQNAKLLLVKNIATAIPVAFIEKKQFGLIHKSFFIALKVDYDFDFHDINFERKKGVDNLFKQFAEFTYQMHSAGFLHLDYTPGNILIKEKGENFDFTVIDINRMKIGPISWSVGAHSLGRMYFKETQMKIIAKRYAELSKVTEAEVWDVIENSHQAFEKKKKLKSILRFWRAK
jgi:thiamine kinase-like enzyme